MAPPSTDDLVRRALAAIAAGDWRNAADLAQQLAQAAPGQPQSAWIAARVALGRGDLAGAAGRLEPLSHDPRLSPQQRAEVLLRLSEALDGLDRTGPAFVAATAGKALQRRAFAGLAASREDAVARFHRLAGWFRAADPAVWARPAAAGASPARSHVVLVGFPRSGTTLLEQALAGHPDVAALEEGPTLAQAHAQFMGSAAGLEQLARMTPAEADHWRRVYWQAVRAAGVEPAGKVFVDKAPAGTLDLPLTTRLFPQAKILFALRDPRDVVLSCLRQDFQMNALTYAFTRLETTADAYDACMAMSQVYRAVLPLDVLEVRHEALVADFAGGLGTVCRHIGLDLQPQMLDVAATARRRTVLTPSAPQVRAGLSQRGVGRWRAYAGELAPVLPTLKPWVAQFGYPTD